MRAARMVMWMVGGILLGGPAVAGAEIGVERQFRYEMPAGFSPYTAAVENEEWGSFLVVETRGEGAQEECVAILSDERGSRVFAYRHEFYPTRCLDGTIDGAGGVFLRGERTDVESGVLSGFTAYIGAEGELRWSLEDQRLLMGALSYEGDYVAPLAGLAFDEERQELVGLTLGERPLLGGARERTQAHRIDVEEGRFVEAGMVYGTQFNDVILDVVAVEDGVLVHVLDGRSLETGFFQMYEDGRVERVRPGGEDWGGREVIEGPRDDGEGGLWLLYEEEGDRVLVGIVEGEVIWRKRLPEEERLEQTTGVDEENPSMGRAQEFWMGGELIVVGYENGVRERFLVFYDFEGEEVTRMRRGELLGEELLALGRGSEGGLRALGFDVETLRFGEYRVFRGDADPGEGEEEEDGEAGGEAAGGCQKSGQEGGPGVEWILMLGLFLCGERRRRECGDCQKMASDLR